MSNKTTGKRKQQDECFGAKWGATEQTRLENYVSEGEIDVFGNASKVREIDPETFDKFSNNVIGYHLGQLKKKTRKLNILLI